MSESPASRQRLLLVTGLLGAGKTTVLRVLEDLGWEAIDNFPIRLLGRLIDSPDGSSGDLRGPLAIGFDSRTRGFDPAKVIDRVKKLAERPDLEVTTLFLDCSGQELERRYNETRRRHPLAQDLPAASGIAAEREAMEPLRRWADMVISTTNFTSNDLQQAIRERFGQSAPASMTVSVTSFGFSRGTPPLADLVFDMRFLDNPHWD
ncbi:MAG: RNase adapter RapZ, partial [Novosphingobium sp.]